MLRTRSFVIAREMKRQEIPGKWQVRVDVFGRSRERAGFAMVERITPCLRNLPPVFRHFPRTAIRKPDSLTAPSVYRKPDGKLLANPHGTLPRKHPFF